MINSTQLEVLMTGIQFDVSVLEKKMSTLLDTLTRERDRVRKLYDPLFIRVDLTDVEQDEFDELEDMVDELEDCISKLEDAIDSVSSASLDLI